MSVVEAIAWSFALLFMVLAVVEAHRGEKLRTELRRAIDDLLRENQSLRSDLEEQDIEVEMDLSAFDDDDDFDDSEEWKQR